MAIKKEHSRSASKRRQTHKKMPLVFISHDNRDSKIAEALAALLRHASSDKVQIFRSSDRQGEEGIASAGIWFETVCKKMKSASQMVCILTTRSVDRQWIFWEAGFAAGQKKPVHSLVIGMPLEDASVGPFAHFQNCPDDKTGLNALVRSVLSHAGIRSTDF